MKNFTQLVFVLLLFTGSAATAQDTTYKEMAGTYKFPAGTVIPEAIVTLENGVLTMSSAEGTSTLEKIKGDTFNIVSFSGIAVFKRNDAKKISGVHIEASGYVFDGVKDGVTIGFINGNELDQLVISTNQLYESTMKVTRDDIVEKRFSYPGTISCFVE